MKNVYFCSFTIGLFSSIDVFCEGIYNSHVAFIIPNLLTVTHGILESPSVDFL